MIHKLGVGTTTRRRRGRPVPLIMVMVMMAMVSSLGVMMMISSSSYCCWTCDAFTVVTTAVHNRRSIPPLGVGVGVVSPFFRFGKNHHGEEFTTSNGRSLDKSQHFLNTRMSSMAATAQPDEDNDDNDNDDKSSNNNNNNNNSVMTATKDIETSIAEKKEELPPSGIGPYTTYQRLIRQRLDEADACDTFVEDIQSMNNNHNDNNNNNNDHSFVLPMVSMKDLAQLASPYSSSSSEKEQHILQLERQELIQQIQDQGGGCVLVELGSIEADIMDGMWSSMEKVYRICDEEHYSLRHQILSRENTNSTPQLAHEQQENVKGYQFITSYIDQGDFVIEPPFVMDVLGMESTWDLLGAYRLMERIGTDLSIMALSSSSSSSSTMSSLCEGEDVVSFSTHIVQSLLSSTPESSCYESEGSGHRLCRYIAQGDGQGTAEQGLATHTDWSLSTPLPVSSICGLEVYIPNHKCWVRPEVEARRHYLAQQQNNNHNHNNNKNSRRWHSNYAIVMIGKWVELLTNGTLKSCVHRVVAGKAGNPPRLSAPFFLRAREDMFVGLRERFDDTFTTSSTSSSSKKGITMEPHYCDLSSTEAIQCMHDYVMEQVKHQQRQPQQPSQSTTTTTSTTADPSSPPKVYRPPKF